MDWSNERYVRLYVRDTTTWKLFSWQARCVLTLLLRKVDRSGVLDVGDAGIEGLAAMVEMPLDVVKVGARDLIRRGTLEETEGGFVLPKFIEAQETRQTDPARARESRERRRAETLRKTSKPCDATAHAVTSGDEPVTTRHQESPAVTPSDPSYATPSESLPRARAIPPPAQTPHRTEQNAKTPTPAIAPDAINNGALISWAMDEVDRMRARVAERFGWKDVRPLHPMDAGRGHLRERLAESGDRAESDLKHVLAVAEAEAIAKGTVEYLSGAMFKYESWGKKIAMRLEDARRGVRAAGSPASTAPTMRVVSSSRPDDGPPGTAAGGKP